MARIGPDVEIAWLYGQLPKVAWCGGSDRGHSKGDGPTIDLTHVSLVPQGGT